MHWLELTKQATDVARVHDEIIHMLVNSGVQPENINTTVIGSKSGNLRLRINVRGGPLYVEVGR
jgi:hypothetical protein